MGEVHEPVPGGWFDWARRGVWAFGLALWRESRTRRRAWIILAAVLVCGYAAGVLGYVVVTPEVGIRCAFTPVVNRFYAEFLYPDDQEPLCAGDRIVAVGDQPVENWSQYLRAMLWLRGRQPAEQAGLTAELLTRADRTGPSFVQIDGQRLVRLVYERPGEEPARRVVWCKLGPAPLVTLVPSILWFVIKIGLFIVGAIVFWQRPADRSASQFFLLCLASFGAYLGGYHWSRIVTQPVLLIVWMGCAIFLPAVTLHFYLVFPSPKAFFDRHVRRYLLVIYGPALVFFLLLLSGYLRIRLLDGAETAGLLARLEGGLPAAGSESASGVRLVLVEMLSEIYCYFGVALLWYLLSLASLVHSYRHAANVTERNQVKWILFGATAACVPLGYSLYMALWEQGRFGGGGATWPMFAASLCVTAAYTVSITRYRLMQLDQMISSGATYFLFSTLAGLVYYGVVFTGLLVVGSQVSEAPSLRQVLGVSSAALVLMLALDVARGRLKRVLDRHFRREKHNLDRTLQRMSQAIDKMVDPPALARVCLHTTSELLGATGGAVYLRQGEPALYRLADVIGSAPPLDVLSSGCPLVEALQTQPTLVQVPFDTTPSQRQLQFIHGAVAQALTHEGQLLGLLVLSRRPSGPYSAEDVQLLAAFAQVTALALVSAEGYRTIETLNHDLKAKIEKIAELQRRIGVLQSQLIRQGAGGRSQESGVRGQESGEGAPAGLTADACFLIPEGGIVGSSPQVLQLLQLVKRVAPSSSPVLLRGESGTGKELLARAVHENSPRKAQPFIKVHCAALAPGLLESELFGHVKGAFTSAIRDKVGRFESADGGTLFLDEIGDISLEVQTKLLRVLEEMTFERVGSSEPVSVDVRIIAATHRDLAAMISEGRFREDLFFRLNVLPIRVPPLRDRIEDIPELVGHFLKVYAGRAGKAVTTIDDDTLAALKGYHWPGNIRQLENVIERAVVIAEGATLTTRELPDEVQASAGELIAAEPYRNGDVDTELSLPLLASQIQAERADRDRREREQLVRALAAAGGNKAEAARALGVARSTLVSRLKKLGLS
jgi:transcriptional regulator with GAF, ATPase, and Fis domain